MSTEISINRFEIMSGYRMHLIYHIDKDLCVFLGEEADHITLITTREDCFDEGEEFMRDECASDQA